MSLLPLLWLMVLSSWRVVRPRFKAGARAIYLATRMVLEASFKATLSTQINLLCFWMEMARFLAKLTLNMQHMLLISLSAWKTMVPEAMDSQMILRLWKQSLTKWIHWFFNSISLIYFSRFDLVCGVQNYILWCRDIHCLLDTNYPCRNSDCRWSVVCDRWEGVSIPRHWKPPTSCSSGREWLTGLDRDYWYAVHDRWPRYVWLLDLVPCLGANLP